MKFLAEMVRNLEVGYTERLKLTGDLYATGRKEHVGLSIVVEASLKSALLPHPAMRAAGHSKA